MNVCLSKRNKKIPNFSSYLIFPRYNFSLFFSLFFTNNFSCVIPYKLCTPLLVNLTLKSLMIITLIIINNLFFFWCFHFLTIFTWFSLIIIIIFFLFHWLIQPTHFFFVWVFWGLHPKAIYFVFVFWVWKVSSLI